MPSPLERTTKSWLKNNRVLRGYRWDFVYQIPITQILTNSLLHVFFYIGRAIDAPRRIAMVVASRKITHLAVNGSHTDCIVAK